MSSDRITIDVSAVVDLAPEEVFPDGVPEEWTIADVVAAIKQSGDAGRFLDDWNIRPTVDVTVDRPNPHHHGDSVLFGDAPPERLVEREEVW